MHSTLKWSLLVVASLMIAAMPTRLSSHDLAIGFPFTWHMRQEIVTLGEQPHSFRALLLLSDFGLALLVLAAVVKVFRMRRA